MGTVVRLLNAAEFDGKLASVSGKVTNTRCATRPLAATWHEPNAAKPKDAVRIEELVDPLLGGDVGTTGRQREPDGSDQRERAREERGNRV